MAEINTVEKYKEKFIELLLATNREGIQSLLDWLESTDFYDAPASTRYHGSYKSGLVVHSVRVCRIIRQLNSSLDLGLPTDSMDIASLLHDLCKADFYSVGVRNKKNEEGKWIQVEQYEVDDKFPFGHGEKSVYLINRFIKLTDDEAMAIRWHMGSYDDSALSYGGKMALGNAYATYPLAVAMHLADMAETHLVK